MMVIVLKMMSIEHSIYEILQSVSTLFADMTVLIHFFVTLNARLSINVMVRPNQDYFNDLYFIIIVRKSLTG